MTTRKNCQARKDFNKVLLIWAAIAAIFLFNNCTNLNLKEFEERQLSSNIVYNSLTIPENEIHRDVEASEIREEPFRSLEGKVSTIRFNPSPKQEIHLALQDLIDSPREEGTDGNIISLEPGTYLMGTPDNSQYSITISDTDNLIIDGQGSKIIMTNPRSSFAKILRSSRVIIRNFVVDFNPLPFSQTIVQSVDPSAGTVRVKVLPGYPAIDDTHFDGPDMVTKGLLKDPINTGRLKADAPNSINVQTFDRIDDDEFELKVGYYFVKYFEPGDHYVHLARGAPSVFEAISSERVTFENISIHSGPGTAFKSGDSSLVNLIGTKVQLLPGRWHTVCADGIIAYRNGVGPWIEDALFEATGDDSININTSAGISLNQPEPGVYLLAGRLDHRYIRQSFSARYGDLLRIYDPISGTLLGESVVASSKRVNYEGQSLIRVTFRSPIPPIPNQNPDDPDAEQSAPIFYNDSRTGSGFVIQNSTFRNTRRYGLIIQSHFGLIDNNRFEGVSGNPILLMNTIHSGSGFAARNIVIRDNDINASYIQNVEKRGANHAALMATSLEKEGYLSASWQGIENIIFVGNEIQYHGNVWSLLISNAQNIEFTENRLTLTESSESHQSEGQQIPILVRNSSDVVISDNTMVDYRYTNFEESVMVAVDAENMTIVGNRMEPSSSVFFGH